MDYVNISDIQVRPCDVWEAGEWKLDLLATQLPSYIRDSILSYPVPHNVVHWVPDCWVWKGNKEGFFSAASGYRWLLDRSRTWVANANWDWIWKVGAPAKLQLLLWQVSHNALPSNSLRHRRGIASSPFWQRCFGGVEEILHILRDCPHPCDVWFRLGMSGNSTFFTEMDVST